MPGGDDAEQRAQIRLRIAAGVVLLALISVMAILAYLAPFLGQELHPDQFIFGTVMGALLLVLGIEVPAWFRRKP